MTVTQFYAADHLGRAYGVRVLGVPHSGQDVNRWAPGTLIPSPASGVVAKKGYSLRYGHWVAVRLADGSYLGAAHMLTASPLKVGAPVKVDTTLGKLGSTGTLSLGPHTHIYYSSVPEPWGRPTKDPMPIIQSALTPPIVKDTDMRVIYNTDNSNDATRRAIVGELSFQVITAGQATRETKLWGAAVNFTQGEWDACLTLVEARRAATGFGGAGGLTDAEVVDDAELGQALTSAVQLINDHTDVKFSEYFV